jgi:hypothetical protein
VHNVVNEIMHGCITHPGVEETTFTMLSTEMGYATSSFMKEVSPDQLQPPNNSSRDISLTADQESGSQECRFTCPCECRWGAKDGTEQIAAFMTPY